MWTSADDYLEKVFAEHRKREAIIEKYKDTDNEDIKTLIEYIKDLKEDVDQYYKESINYKSERNDYWNKYNEYQKAYNYFKRDYKWAIGKEKFEKKFDMFKRINKFKYINEEL